MLEWTEEEINFVKENHLRMSVLEIANKLGRTHSSVENKKGKLGLKGERKHQFNYDFFKAPFDECSAYWLGFIYADGYISSYKELAIQLKSDDFEHLKKFNICLNGNIPVTFFDKQPRYIKGKYTGVSHLCQIRIFSKEMVSDLDALGVHMKKSNNIEFPFFEDSWLEWSFFRGYFDGDGSIYYDKRSNQLRAKITTGSESFRTSASNFLESHGIKTYINGLDCGITGKESHRILFGNMYDHATIYLDRKYKKYINYRHLCLNGQ